MIGNLTPPPTLLQLLGLRHAEEAALAQGLQGSRVQTELMVDRLLPNLTHSSA